MFGPQHALRVRHRVARGLAASAVLAGACAMQTELHAQMRIDDPLPDPLPSPVQVTLVQVATGFVFPTDVAEIPGRAGSYLVTQRNGTVRIVVNGELRAQAFLSIDANVAVNNGSALAALAFHPQFAAAGAAGEGLFYTTSPELAGTGVADFGDAAGAAHQSVVYQWRLSAGNPEQGDAASASEILRIDESIIVHNVNDLVFAQDGTLFIAKGDDDMAANERLDGTTIHGSVLRIALDPGAPNGRYRIPADNPFVGNGAGIIEEIYAYGFRNPWRASIDRMNGDLHVADIGEDDVEEINRIEAGGYYGWIEKEGSFAFLGFNMGVSDDLSGLPMDFDGIDPVAEYDHSLRRRSITGGFIYRGALYPALYGHYVFADWLSGELLHVDPADGVVYTLAIDGTGDLPVAGIISVRQDLDGELLLVSTEQNVVAQTGQVLRWVSNGPAPVADDIAVSTDEDRAVQFAPQGTIVPDSVTVQSAPAAGTVTGSAMFDYTPNPDFHGVDTFTYRGLNADGTPSNVATVTITVTPVNDAPTASDSNFEAITGEPYRGRLSGADVDNDPLSFRVQSMPALGALALNADGSFEYTATAAGADMFSFRSGDGDLESAPATVQILVRDPAPPADPPSVPPDDPPESEATAVAGGILICLLLVLGRRKRMGPGRG